MKQVFNRLWSARWAMSVGLLAGALPVGYAVTSMALDGLREWIDPMMIGEPDEKGRVYLTDLARSIDPNVGFSEHILGISEDLTRNSRTASEYRSPECFTDPGMDDQVRNSIVKLVINDETGMKFGSGTIIKSDRLNMDNRILTAGHVDPARADVMIFDYSGRYLGRAVLEVSAYSSVEDAGLDHDVSDIATLRPVSFASAAIADTWNDRGLHVAKSYPEGRMALSMEDDSIASNGGSSGAAVLNAQNEVVGVFTSTLRSQHLMTGQTKPLFNGQVEKRFSETRSVSDYRLAGYIEYARQNSATDGSIYQFGGTGFAESMAIEAIYESLGLAIEEWGPSSDRFEATMHGFPGSSCASTTMRVTALLEAKSDQPYAVRTAYEDVRSSSKAQIHDPVTGIREFRPAQLEMSERPQRNPRRKSEREDFRVAANPFRQPGLSALSP